MARSSSFNNLVARLALAVATVLLTAELIQAAPFLTEEERSYIAGRGPVQAINVDGAAPIQYIDSHGQPQGISKQILQVISEMTGLTFAYSLTQTPDAVWESEAELIVGIPPSYAPPGLQLSPPFLTSETILFVNSAMDPTDLADKRYAAVEGGSLPEGVLPENTIYFQTREESITAVDQGRADYGYGNAYSLAYYQLQNGYRNVVAIPQGKEAREYCIGYYNADPLLISIIDKALIHADPRRIETMILDMATQIERRITPAMIVDSYGTQIGLVIGAVICVLGSSTAVTLRLNKRLKERNLIHDMLSHISNEYLYEYDVKKERLVLSDKFLALLGDGNGAEVTWMLKERLAEAGEGEIFEVTLPLAGGEMGVFQVVHAEIGSSRAKTNSVVGKLVDITRVAAEREELIAKAETDGLTGLYNPITMKKLITHRLKTREAGSLDALLLLDCDDFKGVNDNYGHLMGDRVLQHVAASLTQVFRSTDFIGRMGGDEFAVYMQDVPSTEFVAKKCVQLKKTVEQPVEGIVITVGVGVALVEGEEDYDEVFSRADRGLYRDKKEW
jgi:diguanylate cyclase (GGDEF)-like protein